MSNPVVDSRIAYVTVEHEYYGCETGCCGWVAYAYDKSGTRLYSSEFDFMGGGGDNERETAREFAEAHFPGATWNEAESDYHCSD